MFDKFSNILKNLTCLDLAGFLMKRLLVATSFKINLLILLTVVLKIVIFLFAHFKRLELSTSWPNDHRLRSAHEEVGRRFRSS